MKYQIALFEVFAEEETAIRLFLPSGLDVFITADTIQESGLNDLPAPIISVRTQSIFPPAWLSDLKAVLTRSTGYDHLLELRDRFNYQGAGGYLPLYCHRAVAEQAAMIWLALMRRLPLQMRQMNSFSRDGLSGSECQGRTLAVFGVGNIGAEVVAIGRGLGMKVLGVDPVQRFPDQIEYTTAENALKQADIISCCMNLNPDNVNYFNLDKWRTVKPGTIFVNVARGEQSPATALLAALREGYLGAVGLDVYPEEKTWADHLRNNQPAEQPEIIALRQLKEMPHVLFTPHNAFNTRESVHRKAEQSVEQLKTFLKEHRFLWPVPDPTC